MATAIGFTGTRLGMTQKQKDKVKLLLSSPHHQEPKYFHHGDEPHSDREAAKIAREYGFKVMPHPPADSSAEAKLARNRLIIFNVKHLIAAPEGFGEYQRSGTWTTVRYARAAGLKGRIVWPCGCLSPLTSTRHEHESEQSQ